MLGAGFPGLALIMLMLPAARSPPMNSLPPLLCLAVLGVGGLPKGEWGGLDNGESLLDAEGTKVKSGSAAAEVCGRPAGVGGERVRFLLVARLWFSDDQADG